MGMVNNTDFKEYGKTPESTENVVSTADAKKETVAEEK